MREIHATFDELHELANTFGKTEARIKELLDDLAKQLRALTERYTGAASEGFKQTLSEWFTAAHDMRDTLRRFEQIMHTTHGNYRNALVTNTKMWPTRSR
jgi:WXG100 family type VII secretion target